MLKKKALKILQIFFFKAVCEVVILLNTLRSSFYRQTCLREKQAIDLSFSYSFEEPYRMIPDSATCSSLENSIVLSKFVYLMKQLFC